MDSHTLCYSYSWRWMLKSSRSERRNRRGAFCKGQVHFILTHTLNVVNDLPHDNCTNKPLWPHMPVSVRAHEANLNTGPHRPACLQRTAAPCQWELRGMWAGLTVHAHVHTLEWNVYTGRGFRTVIMLLPLPPVSSPPSRPQGSEREGGKVERQPALVPVSDFDSHQLVFFRKHLLGHRLHQRKSSPTSLPVGTVKVTVQLWGGGEAMKGGRGWGVFEGTCGMFKVSPTIDLLIMFQIYWRLKKTVESVVKVG